MKDTYKWLSLAVAFLGAGGAFALLVALSRTPFAHAYFPADFLYQGIVGHVILAIVLWLFSFTVMLWGLYMKGSTSGVGRLMGFSWIFALIGAGLVTLSVFLGSGKAVPNNYIPTIDSPLFHLGLFLFFLGLAINAVAFLHDALSGIRSRDPLKNALSISVIAAVVMLAAFVASIAMNTLIRPEAPTALLFYERLFWIPGHIQQVLNGVMLIAVWYALRRAMGVPDPGQGTILKAANYMFLASAAVLFIIPFVADPLARNAKIASEVVYGLGLGVPIFLHAVNILIGLRGRREKGASFVALASLLLSMAIYFFGVGIAYGGFGDDLRVPAHYHGAVTGLTLAMMGLSYNLFKAREKRGLIERLAKVQPIVYGGGMILFISGLLVSGVLGAPRKTFGVEFASDPLVLTALTVMGVGTIMAVTGGVLYVCCATASLLREAR